MNQNFRLENVGLINRDTNYHLNLIAKPITVMKETL